MNSLKTRLLLASLLVLAVFVGLTGLALERAVHERALSAEEDRLQGLVYGLLGVMDIERNAVRVALEELPEPRLQQPDSGVYSVLLDGAGVERWRSPSYLGRLPDALAGDLPPLGEWRFTYLREAAPAFGLAFTLRWLSGETAAEDAGRYHLLVLREAGSFESRQGRFQRTLWTWLVVSAALLTGVQFLVLRWGLAPLRLLARQVGEIEAGRRRSVEGRYPGELRGVVDGLNALLAHEERQKTRYRNALGDLAHSLKTPLAALRSLCESGAGKATPERVDEQVARMDDIVRYQLNKAAVAGTRALAQPVALEPLAGKVVAALGKVYRDKAIDFRLDVRAEAVRADSQDLLEILGNLLDNAAKHCLGRVALRAERVAQGMRLEVDDDGEGFPPDAERLLARGARADTRHAGQGLGLAMVAEIVAAYDGALRLERSSWDGARVVVTLPG